MRSIAISRWRGRDRRTVEDKLPERRPAVVEINVMRQRPVDVEAGAAGQHVALGFGETGRVDDGKARLGQARREARWRAGAAAHVDADAAAIAARRRWLMSSPGLVRGSDWHVAMGLRQAQPGERSRARRRSAAAMMSVMVVDPAARCQAAVRKASIEVLPVSVRSAEHVLDQHEPRPVSRSRRAGRTAGRHGRRRRRRPSHRASFRSVRHRPSDSETERLERKKTRSDFSGSHGA